ncbi:Polycomb group protein fie2 [Asimina triloba]
MDIVKQALSRTKHSRVGRVPLGSGLTHPSSRGPPALEEGLVASSYKRIPRKISLFGFFPEEACLPACLRCWPSQEEVRMAKTTALGCEPVVGSLTATKKREYKVSNRVPEGKRPLYAIAFNFLDSRYYNVFATVGGNRVTIYQCLEGGVIAVLQAFVDEDKDESFYTLSWACNVDGSPFLVAGGINGIIRVIDCGSEKIHKDFHPSDIYRIASCGMDNTVKIWSMKEFWTYVEKSFTWTDLPSKFPTKYVQFPVFIASVHSNYVDCNRWLGDFILSKSVDNEIVLWEPKAKEQTPGEGIADILQKYPVPECDIWFIKFSCDFHYNAAAIGNREGKIYVWELQTSPPVLLARLSHVQCKSPIRQTAMSFDGRYQRKYLYATHTIEIFSVCCPILAHFDD